MQPENNSGLNVTRRQMVKMIEGDANYPRFQELERQINGLTSRSMELERRAVKFERIILPCPPTPPSAAAPSAQA